jgi:hypothetical protein
MAAPLQVRDGQSNLREFALTSSSDLFGTAVIPVHAISDITGSNFLALTASIKALRTDVTGTLVVTGSGENKTHLRTIVSSSTDFPIFVTGTLNAQIDTSDKITVTSSYENPAIVGVSGSVTTDYLYASASVVSSSTAADAKSAVQGIGPVVDGKSVVIANYTNHLLYLAFDNTVSPTNYVYVVDPYSTYESIPTNARLRHAFILDTAATLGTVTATYTK